MNKVFTIIKSHKIISGIILIGIVVGGYSWYQKTKSAAGQISYVTQAAEQTTITVGVTGSGQVSQENKVDLKPASSGQIVSVKAKQGDQVKAGQVIATIDERNASLSVNQARAQLESAQASYDKLIAGLTNTDMQIAQAQ